MDTTFCTPLNHASAHPSHAVIEDSYNANTRIDAHETTRLNRQAIAGVAGLLGVACEVMMTLRPRHAASVADVGAGTGIAGELLATYLSLAYDMRAHRYVAVDRNQNLLDAATARNAAGYEEVISMLTDLNDGGNALSRVAPVDITVASHVLTHVRDPMRTLHHISSLVAESGVLILNESDYARMEASGSDSLRAAVATLKDLLPNHRLNDIDAAAGECGLVRWQSHMDARSLIGADGPGYQSAKSMLSFMGNFVGNDAAAAWRAIIGGKLSLPTITRIFIRTEVHHG